MPSQAIGATGTQVDFGSHASDVADMMPIHFQHPARRVNSMRPGNVTLLSRGSLLSDFS